LRPEPASRTAGFWLVAFAFVIAMLGTTLPTRGASRLCAGRHA